MKKIFFYLQFMLIIRMGLAQPPGNGDPTNYIRTDLVPASPNASSIGRYGEIPVNMSTGMANLSIPLFTVSGNDLSLPVTLNYNYSGYRPVEPVGWVGLGWSLNAGGVISLTVKDRLDNTASLNRDYDDLAIQDSINLAFGPGVEFLNQIAIGHIDSEPDIYSFNFSNYSGKFIRFQGQFYCFPAQKFKISALAGGFKIVTDDGVQYFFTETETSSQKSSQGVYNLPTYTSSWYLTKVTNAANTENIYLDYASESTIIRGSSFVQTLKQFVSSNNYGGPGASDQLFPPVAPYGVYITPKRLVSITSEKYRVSFSGTPRLDVPGTQALSWVTITNSDMAAVKRFLLKHNDLSNLRLDTLIETNYLPGDDGPAQYDTANARKYAFDYVPASGSNWGNAWVDHYGYYTGRGDFNGTMIPNTIYQSGVDRSPVLGGTQQGALTKVTYPTGGYSTFEYELNKVYDGQSYVMNGKTLNDAITRPSNNPNGLISTLPKHFQLTTPQTVTVTISRTPKSSGGDGIVHNPYKDFEIGGDTTLSTWIAMQADNGGKSFTYALAAGTYSIRFYCDANENQVTGQLDYKQQTTTPIEGKEVGGLRIRKITSFPLTGQPSSKEYSYTRPDGFSSGVTNLGAYNQRNMEERESLSGMSWYSNFFLISTSVIGENYQMGVPQYYKSVLESVSSGAGKFSTRTDFESFEDLSMGIEPVRITTYKNAASNQLVPSQLVEYHYERKLENYFHALHPEKTMEAHAGPLPLYAYDMNRYNLVSGWRYLAWQRNMSYEGNDTLETLTENQYDVNGTRNLVSVQTTDSRGLRQITRYKYPQDYAAALAAPFVAANVLAPVFEQQKWRKSGTDSLLLSAVVTKYDSLVYKPVSVSTLGGQNIHILNNQGKDGLGKYLTLLSDTRFEGRVNYAYDSFGKVVGQQLAVGPALSYKWAYSTVPHFPNTSTNKTYVIAECRNAAETEFYYEGFEDDASAAVGPGHTGSHFHDGNLTVSWTRPNARAYLISYWYRSGTVWKFSLPQSYAASSFVLAGGDAYDDIRIYPADAQLTTYTYIPGIGVSSMTDAKNLTTFYEYDLYNRLKNVKDSQGNIRQNLEYHYAGNQLVGYGAGPFSNAAVSVTLARNNCGIYEEGSSLTYTVGAGKYKGATQAEADAYAQADLLANAQNYVNKFGTCTYGGNVE
ncbi:hypothetical protein GWR56_13815 [Mucilaginibacter sp. 14171R-50]|uniref:DUF5977 domain-containing protein n=1 Tax=Mucilaginibacter sp. 14171R-50 TaxID=2703789 RepID=UPI00138D8723|nr:DUF5977 domain-containing protein [Mucilaginibacter sp. 14171R-50]QHS56566.1 hypothetical protein GWR56_13815 [Mucilaginibacter sp. 14171R-50]